MSEHGRHKFELGKWDKTGFEQWLYRIRDNYLKNLNIPIIIHNYLNVIEISQDATTNRLSASDIWWTLQYTYTEALALSSHLYGATPTRKPTKYWRWHGRCSLLSNSFELKVVRAIRSKSYQRRGFNPWEWLYSRSSTILVYTLTPQVTSKHHHVLIGKLLMVDVPFNQGIVYQPRNTCRESRGAARGRGVWQVEGLRC